MVEWLARGLERHQLYSRLVEQGRNRKIIGMVVSRFQEEVVVLNMALWHIGGTLMSETDEYISFSEVHVVATSVEHLPVIIDLKTRNLLPYVTTVLVFQPVPAPLAAAAAALKLEFYSYLQLIEEGKLHPEVPLPGSCRDDIATIIDTSGTTGFDKVEEIVNNGSR
jgi:hypothetical protein